MSKNTVPDYVNELFAKIARENGFNNFLVEINSGSKPGDGFTSDMFRVRISEEKSSKQLELMCKLAPTNINMRKELLSENLFKQEAMFYQTFMPMLAKFQEDKHLPISDQFRSYPKCYGAVIDDENGWYVIVLEDLQPLDFKMWDKTKPTPIENVRITMRELGKFHGLSIALKDQQPTEFAKFKMDNLIKEMIKSKNISDMFGGSYARAADSLKKEEHKKIVRSFNDDILGMFSKVFDQKASDRNGVICHGDCWNNNFLFRFNEKDVAEEICFVDWQILHFGSPAIDLLYNIFTSTDGPLREKEYMNLIRLYHESLSKTVKLLGSDAGKLFTYEDLQGELKRCGVYALMMAPLLLQVMQANSSEIPNIDEEFDKAANGESKIELVKGLSSGGQSEYDRRINEVYEDVIKLGYYERP